MTSSDKSRLDEFVTRPRRAVWVVAGPMIAGFSVHSLYVIIDTIFIGKLGAEALAAATFVSPLFFVAIALINGLAVGITATVAQAIGRRDREGGDRLASNGLGLGIASGLLLAAVGLAGGRHLLPLLGAEGMSLELAWQYFMPLCLGIPIFFVSASLRAVLTGEGDAKTPMIILALATVINVALDPLFIFTFEWGIRGATLATLAAQLFSFSAFAWVVFARKGTHSRFRWRHILPRTALVYAITAIGFPAALVQLVMAFGGGLVNRVLAHFDQVAVAGYGAGSRVDMIVALPIMGLASATVTVIGMFAGAGRADLVRITALYSYRWAITIATIVGVLAYAASDHVIGLFTDDAYALEVGSGYLAFMVFAYPLMAFGMTSGRILLGLGHGIPSLVITILRVLVISIPVAYVAVYAFDAPIPAIWASFIVGGLTSDVVAFFWIREYLWRRGPTLRATAGVP